MPKIPHGNTISELLIGNPISPHENFPLYFLFILVFSTILFTSSCNTTGTRYKDRQYNNKILSKEASVTEIKHLLQVDEIYYFDCDFSNISDIEIVDSSFNISSRVNSSSYDSIPIKSLSSS